MRGTYLRQRRSIRPEVRPSAQPTDHPSIGASLAGLFKAVLSSRGFGEDIHQASIYLSFSNADGTRLLSSLPRSLADYNYADFIYHPTKRAEYYTTSFLPCLASCPSSVFSHVRELRILGKISFCGALHLRSVRSVLAVRPSVHGWLSRSIIQISQSQIGSERRRAAAAFTRASGGAGLSKRL